MREIVSKLKPRYRKLIELRYFKEYSYEEIARITGLSESQVKVYIFRGRSFLKKYLGSIETFI